MEDSIHKRQAGANNAYFPAVQGSFGPNRIEVSIMPRRESLKNAIS